MPGRSRSRARSAEPSAGYRPSASAGSRCLAAPGRPRATGARALGAGQPHPCTGRAVGLRRTWPGAESPAFPPRIAPSGARPALSMGRGRVPGRKRRPCLARRSPPRQVPSFPPGRSGRRSAQVDRTGSRLRAVSPRRPTSHEARSAQICARAGNPSRGWTGGSSDGAGGRMRRARRDGKAPIPRLTRFGAGCAGRSTRPMEARSTRSPPSGRIARRARGSPDPIPCPCAAYRDTRSRD